jgi:hypothetical protein
MAYPYGNQLYQKGRNHFLRGDLSWKSGATGWRAYLVDLLGLAGSPTPYTPNFATDEFLSAIPSVCLISEIALAPADPVDGVADCPDVTFLAVTGAICQAIVIVHWVTSAADSQLVAYIDGATNLPVIPNGGDIACNWGDVSDLDIFKL